MAKVEKSAEYTSIYVLVVNKWYIGTLLGSKYSEGKKTAIRNKYVLLIAFYTYLQDDYSDKLPTDEEMKIYDKVSRSQLEIAARTILTSVTSEKAFRDMD